MSDDLYQTDLLRLAAEARGTGRLPHPDASVTMDNPLCGDRVTIDLTMSDGRVSALGHEVKACVLCQAAATVIGRHAVGETAATLRRTATRIGLLLKPATAEAADAATGQAADEDWPELAAFRAVAPHKSRHACVSLPFRALVKALDESVSAEYHA